MPAKPPALRFTVEPDEKDWLAANWLVIRHRWLWQRLIVSLLVLWLAYAALIVALKTLDYGWDARWALSEAVNAGKYAAIVAAIVFLLTLFMVPWRVRRQLKDSRRLVTATEVACDDAGLQTKNAIGGVTIRWPQFKRLLEGSRVLALMVTEREMLVIPKAQVTPETLEFIRGRMSILEASEQHL